MPVKTRMAHVDQPTPQDMVIGPNGELPMFEGMDQESLVCPGCAQEVTSGVSSLTLMSLFHPPSRLLFHCRCDAYGIVCE